MKIFTPISFGGGGEGASYLDLKPPFHVVKSEREDAESKTAEIVDSRAV